MRWPPYRETGTSKAIVKAKHNNSTDYRQIVFRTATGSDKQGRSFPLGPMVQRGGVNFSVFAKQAKGIDLLFFDRVDDPKPARVIRLDPEMNRTYHYWHTFVPGITPGQLYGYRVYGSFFPEKGLRFNPDKVLLDPYAKAIARPKGYDRSAMCEPGDNTALAIKSVVVDVGSYEWDSDVPPRTPFTKTILYELHVGGFTSHPNSGLPDYLRGTYRGLIGKIPYLRDLGITAVELLPVFAFDEQDGPEGLENYWGYSPISFFSPHPGYSSRPEPLDVLDEFRDMIKALHKAGVEVVLDVVYNHTAEGNEHGPVLCFRGLSNETYYILQQNKAFYANYTGCGNTLNANESVCRRLILDSLRYWVSVMHVDGFRFDLASILSRDKYGHPMASPPVLWDIDSDPILTNVKLIAEAWDPGGLYQVGTFPGDRWHEWNGRFRDDVRSFIKGDNGMAGTFAHRLLASPDIYGHKEREPEQSINFVTCHDGFTLNDLVTYNGKHNEANREENRDGSDSNLSWNCGVEGGTADPEVERLRNQQVKNLLALTLLSAGTPMLLMGDEVRRTQNGNNNAYCQNNETSWFDWDLLDRHQDVYRFTKTLAAVRLHRALANGRSGVTLNELLLENLVRWHGVRIDCPDWGQQSHTLAATISFPVNQLLLHLIVNSFWEPLTFDIPPPGPGHEGWRRCIDTSLESPHDIYDRNSAPTIASSSYVAAPRSLVLLIAEPLDGTI